ncbi:MAG: bifunctional diaminohydroxyphosphoribosylaminopyrimidine deaminase/5-amino-6-(5-phosphoribosylamino)uracil reductase RibD [Bacteroidota bacterium]
MSDQYLYMDRALELAVLGIGNVSPNPMVGCVVVHDNKIIGEGYHQNYGGPHAEVNAINSVFDPSVLKNSTVFVTLEPCSHFGKTPPCADLLIEKGVQRVVIATEDPNPKVAGRGAKRMIDAGIKVEIGLRRDEAVELNRRFFTAFEKLRPYIILKWAQTSDGFIARENYDSKWISDGYSRTIVHQWRAQEDAILVGKNTAKYDNPKLTVRGISGTDPLRIVIDPNLELSSDLYLFSDGKPTLCYNTKESRMDNSVEFVKVLKDDFLDEMLMDLGKRGIRSLIVEGGLKTFDGLVNRSLWDEARVFISGKSFEKGVAAPQILNKSYQEETLLDDKLFIYRNA